MNIRAVLSVFYIGMGGGDAAKVLGMLGVGGSLSFEQNFTNHSPKISKIISKMCDNLIYDSFAEEVIVTIKEKHPFYRDKHNLNNIKEWFTKKNSTNYQIAYR